MPSAKVLGVYIGSNHGVILKYEMGSTLWGTNYSIWNDLNNFGSIDEYVKESGVPSANSNLRWPFIILQAERTGGSSSTSFEVYVTYLD